MNEGIDSGDILFQKEYPLVPQPVDYDTVVDPLVRAETLIALMQLCHGDLSAVPSLRQADAGHTFYIIHPVLKHLALLNGEGAN
jgi:methionyl-tRNA formyltransferase